MIQDARKLDFPGKFDAVCLGPYLVREVFSNTSKTFNGQTFPTCTSGSRCKEYRALRHLVFGARDHVIHPPMGANYVSPNEAPTFVLGFNDVGVCFKIIIVI